MHIHIRDITQWWKKWNITICDNVDEPRGYYASEISHMTIAKYCITSLINEFLKQIEANE